jgi:hypothetical protein
MLLYNGNPISMEPPNHMVLLVEYAEPAMRGNTATNLTKPVKLETGADVIVPAFIEQGDMIKVDTRTGEYLERVAEVASGGPSACLCLTRPSRPRAPHIPSPDVRLRPPGYGSLGPACAAPSMAPLVSYAGSRDTGSPKPPSTIDCRAGRPALESERRFAKKTEATMARVFVKT